MRVFVAGATGVVGRALVPRLIEAGHVVTAMTRNRDRADRFAAQGVAPVACDVYDEKGVEEAEDIVQDAFLRLYRAGESTEVASPKAYL